MNPIQINHLNRQQRGILLHHQGAVKPTADPHIYVVASQTDPENTSYMVWWDEQEPECSCPDWQKRGKGHWCKHCHAVDTYRLCAPTPSPTPPPRVPRTTIQQDIEALYGPDPGNGRVVTVPPPKRRPVPAPAEQPQDPLIPCPVCGRWPCTCRRTVSEAEKRYQAGLARQRERETEPHHHGWNQADQGWEPIYHPGCPVCQDLRAAEEDEAPEHR